MDLKQNSKESTEAPEMNRRELISNGGAAGLGLLGGFGGLGLGRMAMKTPQANMDQQIINTATTAEMLATTMYYYTIATTGGIFQNGLAGNAPDQAYLVAGYEQELNHYQFLVRSAGGKPFTHTFYFPENMFVDPQTTINTIVTLEDAFIAAYLLGVQDFSSPTLQVYAAQIMGVEAEHRVLARVVANDLGLTQVTGLSGMAESVVAPHYTANNLDYERTFATDFPNIDAVVAALTPFTQPGATGFSTTAYSFETAIVQAHESAMQPYVYMNGKTVSG